MEWSCCKDGVCKKCQKKLGDCACGAHPLREEDYKE